MAFPTYEVTGHSLRLLPVKHVHASIAVLCDAYNVACCLSMTPSYMPCFQLKHIFNISH